MEQNLGHSCEHRAGDSPAAPPEPELGAARVDGRAARMARDALGLSAPQTRHPLLHAAQREDHLLSQAEGDGDGRGAALHSLHSLHSITRRDTEQCSQRNVTHACTSTQ